MLHKNFTSEQPCCAIFRRYNNQSVTGNAQKRIWKEKANPELLIIVIHIRNCITRYPKVISEEAASPNVVGIAIEMLLHSTSSINWHRFWGSSTKQYSESNVLCLAHLAFLSQRSGRIHQTASRYVQQFLHIPLIYAAHGSFNLICQVAPVSIVT